MKYRMFFSVILLASITSINAMNSSRRKSSEEFIRISPKKRTSVDRKPAEPLSPRDKQKLLKINGYEEQNRNLFRLGINNNGQKQRA